MSGATSLAGFADPVLDSQAAFRAVLEAMSRPGRVQRMPVPPEVPEGIGPAAAAVLLALADADTPVRLAAGPAAEAWIRFHTGARAAAVAEAAFVLDPEARLPDLDCGTEEEPERGATLVLPVDGLAEGSGWRLSGPGIQGTHRLAVAGAPPGFLADWAASRGRFPRGVDVILCAGDQVAALPRGVTIEGG
ncbi:phosphonate C-P lyase system protein PhnH [Falsiroseomonas ponticola]|uniref:phosphonate C-P lyase system protein PhnH n=1 Tax=Falsiroseomonas ponticola TaxID=2786951 RepID=UPI0019325C9B|nr:phosphonate C-P lyase system protein PhnH [Roseomonas ponticola]